MVHLYQPCHGNSWWQQGKGDLSWRLEGMTPAAGMVHCLGLDYLPSYIYDANDCQAQAPASSNTSAPRRERLSP